MRVFRRAYGFRRAKFVISTCTPDEPLSPGFLVSSVIADDPHSLTKLVAG